MFKRRCKGPGIRPETAGQSARWREKRRLALAGRPGEASAGRGRQRVTQGIARNATEASVGALSGQGSQLHMEELSLAPAGGGVQGPWERGGARAHGRDRALLWKSH